MISQALPFDTNYKINKEQKVPLLEWDGMKFHFNLWQYIKKFQPYMATKLCRKENLSPTAKRGNPKLPSGWCLMERQFLLMVLLLQKWFFFFYSDSSQNIQVQTEVAAKWANQPTRKRNQGPIIIGPQGAVLYTIKQSCPHKSKLSLPANLQKTRNGNPNT